MDKSVICLPAVFENKQDVVSEGVPVLLQDPTRIIKHLKQKTQDIIDVTAVQERAKRA